MLGSSQRPRGRFLDYVEVPPLRGTKRSLDQINLPGSSTPDAPQSPPRKRGKADNSDASSVATPASVAPFRLLALRFDHLQKIPSPPLSPTVSEIMPEPSASVSRPSSPTASDWEKDSLAVSRLATPHVGSGTLSEKEIGDEEPEAYVYQVAEDEVEESPDLEVEGEFFDKEEDSDDDSDDEVVPVRLLDDFTIYDTSTKQVIPTALLPFPSPSGTSYSASGIVRRWEEEDDGWSDDGTDEEDDTESDSRSPRLHHYRDRVKLTEILEFNVHDITQYPKKIALDGKIYIRTKYAWYILGMPSLQYSPHFTTFWRPHRITHLLLSAVLADPAIEIDQFCEILPSLDREDNKVATAEDILGRAFSEDDFDENDTKAYVISTVQDLRNDLKINRSPVVRTLLADPFATNRPSESYSPESNTTRPGRKREGKLAKDINHRVNQLPTFTTPIVGRIAQDFFPGGVKIVTTGTPASEKEVELGHSCVPTTIHKYNTDKIKWGKRLSANTEYYHEVYIDGTKYEVDDVVMMMADTEYGGKHNYGRSTNLYGNTMCIYTRCNFKFLQPGEEEPAEDSNPHLNNFHSGLFYNHDFAEFVDFPESFLNSLEGSGCCSSCQFEEKEELRCTPVITDDDGIAYGGVHYHPNDFVYVIPPGNTKLLLIGQILEIQETSPRKPMLLIQFHKRHSELEKAERIEPFCNPANEGLFIDERRLILTSNSTHIESRSPEFLSGLCYVRQISNVDEIEKWIQHDDHFFVKDIIAADGRPRRLKPGEFQVCSTCLEEREGKMAEKEQFKQSASKLVGLELFAGAGGLGYGMELSQFVETRWAVEFMPSAASTYQSTMPCNMLSYVEYYQPKYFLLENVAGLLDYKLQDKHATSNKTKEIQFGMLKFILRTLISLGYQVRYKLLQAIHYGVPQSRARIIFFGAKKGLTLPEFPVPVYAFTKGVFRASIPIGEKGKLTKIPPPSRWKSKKSGDGHEKLFHQCAPFEITTIFGAIGDLPPFDWENPHLVCKPRKKASKSKQSKKSDSNDEDRTWFGHPIPEFHAWGNKRDKSNYRLLQPVGYTEGAEYATEPQNRYQQWLRRNIGKDDLLTQHYTSRFSARQVEATASVPLRPKAFHVDLPEVLWPDHAKPGRKQTNKAFYGRLDGDQFFKCAMTLMSPNLKETWPLHPLQKRIYSVRECARAQGFPDDYEFCSVYDMETDPTKVVADQIKQIGNAVAVPFALALGKEIGEACIVDWQKQQREGSVEL
ncbi:hypothetical protein H1R20_g1454, partial [Candolleomyces eurysporus]